jgi:hypothetical protein
VPPHPFHVPVISVGQEEAVEGLIKNIPVEAKRSFLHRLLEYRRCHDFRQELGQSFIDIVLYFEEVVIVNFAVDGSKRRLSDMSELSKRMGQSESLTKVTMLPSW